MLKQTIKTWVVISILVFLVGCNTRPRKSIFTKHRTVKTTQPFYFPPRNSEIEKKFKEGEKLLKRAKDEKDCVDAWNIFSSITTSRRSTAADKSKAERLMKQCDQRARSIRHQREPEAPRTRYAGVWNHFRREKSSKAKKAKKEIEGMMNDIRRHNVSSERLSEWKMFSPPRSVARDYHIVYGLYAWRLHLRSGDDGWKQVTKRSFERAKEAHRRWGNLYKETSPFSVCPACWTTDTRIMWE